jgi:ATP-binding cassette subfamily C protein
LYKKEVCQEKQFYFEPSQTVRMEKSRVLTVKRAITHQEKSKINWIKIESGELEFLSYPSLNISSGYFPLTYTAWVKTRTEAVITEYESTKEWKAGLFNLHRILYAYLDARRQIDELQSKVLAEKRFEKEEEEIHLSLEEMVSVLNPIEPEAMTGSFNPLFKACQLVASYLKISIQMPPELPQGDNMMEHVKAIANMSSIRYRRVKLVGTWWKKNCGPLVAFQGPELKPVALLEKRPGRYEMIDPDTKMRTAVDKNSAATLSKIGFYLYPTFPDDLKTGKDMVKFYFKYNAKEYLPLIEADRHFAFSGSCQLINFLFLPLDDSCQN